MIGRNLDQDDPDAVGVLYPHLGQAPRLCGRLPDDRDASRGEPGMLHADITDLDPDHHRAARRIGPMPGDLEKARAEKEDRPGIFRRPELPVDGQPENVPVEAAAAAQIAGTQEDPAAPNVQAAIRASR